MISVIIPLYNKEFYIKKTLQCVLDQTFQDFEIVIVNDGSTDQGPELVRTYSDKRIKLVNKKNEGVSAARNDGVNNSKYDYLAFLDADDEWLPNHLEVIQSLILKNGDKANVFTTNFARKYSDEDIKPNRDKNELPNGIIDNYFKEALKKAVIHTSCVSISRKAFLNVNGFDEKISRGEDMELWSKLARRYSVAYSNNTTSYYLIDAINSCSYSLPEPDKIYAYYIDLKFCVNKFDRKLTKETLVRRTLRYLILDKNFIFFFKIFRKQFKQYFQ